MKSSGSLIKFKLHKTTGWSEFADTYINRKYEILSVKTFA